jgi:hypothetical protein
MNRGAIHLNCPDIYVGDQGKNLKIGGFNPHSWHKSLKVYAYAERRDWERGGKVIWLCRHLRFARHLPSMSGGGKNIVSQIDW